MKFIKHIFFMMAIAAMALAVVTSWPTKPVSNASAAMSDLQQEDVFQPMMDSYVASGSQWADNPRGESAGLFVGYGDSEAFNLERTRTFLQFDLTSLEGKVATGDATLRLYFTFMTAESPGQTMNIEIHKVTQSWDNQTTWNNQPSYEPTVITSQPVDTEFGRWIEWQIPQDVIQDWIKNPEQNYGIALVSPDGETPGRHIRNFHSKEFEDPSLAPELRVSSAVPTPVPASPTPIPTATPIPPRLSLKLENEPSDEVAAGDKITYTISYSNTSEADITLNNVVITGSIPISTTLETASISDPRAQILTKTHEIVLNVGNLPRGQNGQLIYSVSPTNQMAISTIPMMNVITTPTDSIRQSVGPNRSTTTSFRSPFLSNLAIEPATEPRMTGMPIPIVNCVEASSNETGRVEICAYNPKPRLYLPMVSKE